MSTRYQYARLDRTLQQLEQAHQDQDDLLVYCYDMVVGMQLDERRRKYERSLRTLRATEGIDLSDAAIADEVAELSHDSPRDFEARSLGKARKLYARSPYRGRRPGQARTNQPTYDAHMRRIVATATANGLTYGEALAGGR
jgi:hypothetical protein